MDCCTLPPEVFETVLAYLDLESVKALRLTSQSLAQRCLGPRFLGTIQQPIFDVSSHNLRSLRALSCNPTLSKRIYALTFLATNLESSELERNVRTGRYIKRRSNGPFCTAIGVEYTPEELSSAISDLNWLKDQQEARANESSDEMVELLQLALKGFSELDSIYFDGAFIVGRTQRESTQKGKWHPLWMRASHIFSLVVKAIVQSGASVKKLEVYRSTPRCCIPSSHITSYMSDLDQGKLEMLSTDLQTLKLSMSAEIDNTLDITAMDKDPLGEFEKGCEELFNSPEGMRGLLTSEDPRAVLADGTPGITSILKSASALRELDLSFCHTLIGGKLHSYDRIIDSIAHEVEFPRLEKCALSGFLAKGESILLFLQKHPDLTSFTLHECTLTTGSWTPIFSHLDQSMSRLENLSLSNLSGKHMQNMNYAPRTAHQHPNETAQEEQGGQEVDGLVNLQPIWDTDRPPRWSCFSAAGGTYVHTRSFTREELEKGLVFRPLRRGIGRAKGSMELMRWRKSRSALYGPP
ncbi:hypothetical protein BDV34DRAFT_184428 [Aspergillus parasiticus]|uniref:Uncharacterized protein n=1 Tax=Aspergillus parasiticus TaxID=5067 RepID=A0A5N6E4U3_ASPPA|nr:hypothetical protein BDV34DRAFT_184428 [Aspergillus parasiticus]